MEGIIENAVLKGLSQIQVRILQLIMENPEVTISRLAECLGTSVSKIRHERSRLEKQGIFLCRKGATKKGQWEIIVK
ncbi:MAG: winged helix-turn-helix transcriptional regulator [Muribaculaceae bacterium]|nr:winged helix-turn-helix transcriptional regulator [Muribaculaceae bacterium]